MAGFPDKENKALAPDKLLVVSQSPDAVMKYFSFANQLSGGFGENRDIGIFLIVFKGSIFGSNGLERLIEFLSRFLVLSGFPGCHFVYSDVMPVLQVMGE